MYQYKDQHHDNETPVGDNSFICCGAVVSSSTMRNSRACGKGTRISSSTLYDSHVCCGTGLSSSTVYRSRICGTRHSSASLIPRLERCQIASSTVYDSRIGVSLVSGSTIKDSRIGDSEIRSSTVTDCVLYDLTRHSQGITGDRSGRGRFEFDPHYMPIQPDHHHHHHDVDHRVSSWVSSVAFPSESKTETQGHDMGEKSPLMPAMATRLDDRAITGQPMPTFVAAPVVIIEGSTAAHVPAGYPITRVPPNVDVAALIDQEAAELELEKKKERERWVRGLDNADLNALLRTFDKQVQNVHIAPPPYDSFDAANRGIDLQPSEDEEFTVDKLRSSLERFYASVITGLLRSAKEVQRIRRWEEGGSRTTVALVVYSIAFYYNHISTAVLLFFSVLVLVPSSRRFCFASPQKIPSASSPEAQGEPRRYADTETKASNWAEEMQDLFTSFASPGSVGSGGKVGDMDVSEEVNGVMVRDMERRGDSDSAEGKSKKEMAMELYGKPSMKIIGGLADKWERVANALEPTPPFLLEPARTRVFSWLIAPLLGVCSSTSLILRLTPTSSVLSLFVTERMVCRALGLTFGFLLFGKPVMDVVLAELDRRIPRWRERLILENNILSDVPTNSQLILRLLRDAEHTRQPLPPPSPPPEDDDDGSDDSDVNSDGDSMKMKQKMKKTADKMQSKTRTKARKAWDKAGAIKEEGFAWITGHKNIHSEGKARSTLRKLHISEDSKPAKAVIEHFHDKDEDSTSSADRFYVHHWKHGPGHLIIHRPTIPESGTDSFTSATITFTTIRHVPAARNVSVNPDETPDEGHLTISVNDIIAIKKEGMNWPGRILTSWALDADGAGGTGLEIQIIRRDLAGTSAIDANTDAQGGRAETIRLKAIVRRNELFDRLLALGDQRWEMY
ncbi:hypothetical protein P7C73_g2149, partial [Tremellales sp. Uapishka_1]